MDHRRHGLRREALETVGGFDERFRRAFREDADLALRALAAGWSVTAGTRTTAHPVRPADRWISVRLQRGNADDVLMTRLHGRDWWTRAAAPRGRLPRHLAVTAAALATVACAALRKPAATAVCATASWPAPPSSPWRASCPAHGTARRCSPWP